MPKSLISKSKASELLEIPTNKFDRLGVKPVDTYKNEYKKTCYLFDYSEIEKLKGSNIVEDLKPKPRKPKDWSLVFEKKYGNKENAIKDVADAMFNLNRYTKHSRCKHENREDIYGLKNRLVKYLYLNGYCHECYLHIKETPDKECRSCYGSGIHFRSGEECWSCQGTGIYYGFSAEFVVFRFNVHHEIYTWHQPKEMVNFEVKFTSDEGELNETEIKPIFYKRDQLYKLKALVRWFLEDKK